MNEDFISMYFTGKKCCFGDHFESEAREHHSLRISGLVNATEAPPFDSDWNRLCFKCHFKVESKHSYTTQDMAT